MEQLRDILPGEPPEFAHVCDFFKQGTPDNVWVPKIASEGRWIVISSDGAKKANKGGKLPDLCLAYKVTHVILSPTLHKKTAGEKVSALGFIWGQIENLDKEPAGTRFKLRFKTTKGSRALTLVLQKDEPPADPGHDAPTQG